MLDAGSKLEIKPDGPLQRGRIPLLFIVRQWSLALVGFLLLLSSGHSHTRRLELTNQGRAKN